jgi:hypothetical protein
MQEDLASIKTSVTEKEVILTDINCATGRYLECRSLDLPKDYETLKRLQSDIFPVKYILLSNYVLSKRVWQYWWPVFENQEEIKNFTLIKRFSNGMLLYLNKNFSEK